MSWKNKIKSTIKEFHKWHYNTKNVKLSVRLDESNIERLKIKIENKGRLKLEKPSKKISYILLKKEVVGTSIFPPTQ